MNGRYRLLITAVIGLIIFWKCLTYYQNNKALESADKLVSDKVLVTVYYEALCPDTKNFIINQLVPTYHLLHKYIDLELIPYGNAKTKKDANGNLEFRCQHGPSECLGNKLHACAIKYQPDIMNQLKFVACFIYDALIPFEAAEKCTKDSEINYKDIAKCANSSEGSLLLEVYGEKTHAVSPRITFIPTITLDDTQTVALNLLLKDLKGEICKYLKKTPSECY